jgi:hypothetical protein
MKLLLTITSIVVLGVALLLGAYGHTTAMIVAGLASMAFLIAANLDRITEFKASRTGFEAKTREVTEVIEKAENTITELQLLSKEMAKLTLSLVKRSGRWGKTYEFDEEESIRESVLNVLKKLGIPETENPDLLSDWHKFDDFDYSRSVLGNGHIPQNLAPEFIEEWQLLIRGGLSNIPTPPAIRVFLNKTGLMTPEFEERVKDYEYYLEHRKHRRPDEWRNHLKWELSRRLPEE